MKYNFTVVVIIISILLSAKTTVLSQIELEPVGTYTSGLFDMSASEIVAHDPRTQRIFVVNAAVGHVDVIGIKNPANPILLFQIDVSYYGASANSVDVYEGVVAVAVEADPAQSPGAVVFFDVDGNFLNVVTVGALPDMLTFTPNGRYVLVANEGQPDTYEKPGEANDPEGTISVIDMLRGAANLTQADVRTSRFPQIYSRRFGPLRSESLDRLPVSHKISSLNTSQFRTTRAERGLCFRRTTRSQLWTSRPPTITEILPARIKKIMRET